MPIAHGCDVLITNPLRTKPLGEIKQILLGTCNSANKLAIFLPRVDRTFRPCNSSIFQHFFSLPERGHRDTLAGDAYLEMNNLGLYSVKTSLIRQTAHGEDISKYCKSLMNE